MRAWFDSRMPSLGPVLGARVPRTQSAPSSRWGRNSEPMTPPNAKYKATHNANTAAPTATKQKPPTHLKDPPHVTVSKYLPRTPRNAEPFEENRTDTIA